MALWSVHASGSSSPGSSPGQGHCPTFLGNNITLTVLLLSTGSGKVNTGIKILLVTSGHTKKGDRLTCRLNLTLPSHYVKDHCLKKHSSRKHNVK